MAQAAHPKRAERKKRWQEQREKGEMRSISIIGLPEAYSSEGALNEETSIIYMP